MPFKLQRPQSWSKSFWKGISEKWYSRPGTLGGIRDTRPGTHLIGGTRDLRLRTQLIGGTQDSRLETLGVGPKTWDLEVDFLKIVSIFSDALRLWMNSYALYVYGCFACFSLPYLKAYTRHISFIILMTLIYLVSQFLQKLPPWSCYEVFKFPTKPMIIVRTQTESSEKDLNRWK